MRDEEMNWSRGGFQVAANSRGAKDMVHPPCVDDAVPGVPKQFSQKQ